MVRRVGVALDVSTKRSSTLCQEHAVKVSLDTNALYTTQAGSARYVRGLLHGFDRLPSGQVEVTQSAWPVENFGFRQPTRAWRTFYRECIWARWVAPRQIRRSGATIYHSTATILARPPGLKHVASLLDLAMLRHPERFRPWHLRSAQRSLAKLQSADRIVCISRFTADEAIELLGLPAHRLEVVHCGCDFHPDEPPPSTEPPALPLPAEFFLFVGSLEPGKNLALLREVYALAKREHASLPPLLIVGAAAPGLTDPDPGADSLLYLGRVADPILAHLYQRALALVFPSKYEGFGLPVCEAMALGCPVICSPVASLPEVGGDAACYAPLEAPAYLSAMRKMAADTSFRNDCVQRGHAHARLFSWRRCAEQVLQVYRSV
jgi:glycosyltransferase involved in cell wall biosynthesis